MTMRLFLVLVLAACATPLQEGAVKKDLDAMQGDWTLRWGEREGQQVDFPPGHVYTIRGDKYCLKDRELVRLKLDPTCNPKLLDLTFVDEDDAAKGQTAEGIYKLEGDTMVWCWYTGDGVKQRPVEFKPEKGSERLVYRFVRVKR